MNKKYLIFLGIIIVGAGAVFIFDGYWPVVFVGGSSVSYRTFEKSYQASLSYYQNGLKAENEDPNMANSDDFKKDLKRAVLESLIEQKLIEAVLAETIKKSDLERMVAERIAKFNVDSQNFIIGAQLLYGLPAEEFKKIVLIPKAEREIFESRLIGDNQTLDNWIATQKSQAKVSILISGFSWSEGKVVVE